MTNPTGKNYTPLIILLLVASLVGVIGLWATDKSGSRLASGAAGKLQKEN